MSDVKLTNEQKQDIIDAYKATFTTGQNSIPNGLGQGGSTTGGWGIPGTNLPWHVQPQPCPTCGSCPTCGRRARKVITYGYPGYYWQEY